MPRGTQIKLLPQRRVNIGPINTAWYYAIHMLRNDMRKVQRIITNYANAIAPIDIVNIDAISIIQHQHILPRWPLHLIKPNLNRSPLNVVLGVN